MDENPDLKFSCSSASLYRNIEDYDPSLFDRIKELVQEKRWEITGGWEVQSDVIISRPETLIRQAVIGKKYFLDSFNVDVKTAYCVDSFGHSAGLPKILQASGFDNYVYMRSNSTPGVFRWVAEDGSSVTALHILHSYNTGAGDDFLKLSLRLNLESPLDHQAMFFGVGDHGGGISRRELAFIREMQKEYDIVFATLEEYFDIVKSQPLPSITGELGPIFRGCYSNCHEVKRKIARATRRLLTAEKLGADASELDKPWKELLFNHFHDILPGTSIREAFDKDIFPGIGSVEHEADAVIDRQLFRRSAKLDTRFMTEGGVYAWNPHPFASDVIMSFEGFADPNRNDKNFNVLRDADGAEIPLQILPPASTLGPCGVPWGKLTAVIQLESMGEKVLAYGVSKRRFPVLDYSRQYDLLKGLALEVCFDDSRTWGFGLNRFDSTLGFMELIKTEEFITGPVCSVLRIHYRYKNSSATVDLYRYAGIDEIGVRIRLDWHEIKCALKLCWAHNLEQPEFFTGSSAAVVCRMDKSNYDWLAEEWRGNQITTKNPFVDEFSMIDWCAALNDDCCAAFFAPDIHSCDHADNVMRLTILRPVRYADYINFAPNEESGWMDLGVNYRSLWIACYDKTTSAELSKLAQKRLVNGEIREITAHVPGKGIELPFHFTINDPHVVLLSLRINEVGQKEAVLLNYGNKTTVTISGVGKIEIEANALKSVLI
jgi:alpha-mannosidase